MSQIRLELLTALYSSHEEAIDISMVGDGRQQWQVVQQKSRDLGTEGCARRVKACMCGSLAWMRGNLRTEAALYWVLSGGYPALEVMGGLKREGCKLELGNISKLLKLWWVAARMGCWRCGTVAMPQHCVMHGASLSFSDGLTLPRIHCFQQDNSSTSHSCAQIVP
jgi:hypothetical protein